MLSASLNAPQFISVRGIRQEVWIGGSGRPVLFLHPALGLHGAEPFIALLAEHSKVIVPSHPGFGRSELPDWMSTVDDLAYFYLDFLDEIDLCDVVIVGSSFGGWIAAEIAVKSTERVARIVLADCLGIKVGDHENRDIADIYALPGAELDRRLYSKIEMKPDFVGMSDEQLTVIARNREAEALFGWNPYMHDPAMLRRLHRIRVPTLVLWGASDGIVSLDYGRAFAAAIPGAVFDVVEGAAHFPHIEQPQEVARRVLDFAIPSRPAHVSA